MIYPNLNYYEYCECGEAVKKYRDEHFEDGWQICDDDMTVLFNSKTGEYCQFYVASYEDFERDDGYYASKGLLNFNYFVSNREDLEDAEKRFKDIKYHVVISACLDKIVRLCKKRLYCSDAGCYILIANPADVVEF